MFTDTQQWHKTQHGQRGTAKEIKRRTITNTTHKHLFYQQFRTMRVLLIPLAPSPEVQLQRVVLLQSSSLCTLHDLLEACQSLLFGELEAATKVDL